MFADGQAGNVDDAQGAVVAVGDEGMTAVVAERDFVMPGTGRQVFEDLEALGVDHRDPGFLGGFGVVADPQQAFVRLQRQPHRVVAGDYRVGQLELLAVDHRHLPGSGHRYEYAFVVPGRHPVHRRLLDIDPGHGAGDPAHRY
ncbi:hypothetical protein D3C84_953880 [compost metagenome]